MTELKKVTQLAWRRFLMTPEGQEGMLFAREKTPSIQKGKSEEMIFDAGKVEGFKIALDIFPEIIGVAPIKDQQAENI